MLLSLVLEAVCKDIHGFHNLYGLTQLVVLVFVSKCELSMFSDSFIIKGIQLHNHFWQKMSNKEELVFVNCIHEGCKSERMFLKHPKEQLPEYVCTKHRRLYDIF